jgi:signal transduction histidine kinase
VLLEWSQFDEASTVDEVPVEVLTHEVESTETGTEIVIEDLHQAWSRPQVKRLARTLLLLADPFGSTDNSFELELACPEHPDLETLVASSYFDYAYWSLSAELDDRGRARMHLIDTRLGLDEYVEHEELAGAYSGEDRTYATLPATFELHGFLRSAEALHGMGTAATLEGLKAWLDAYGGVHIYHRGLRVAPYGDSGSDWLDMNLLRARNPEQRPSTSTAVGRVLVEDPTGVLVQKTDRSGFIEDDRFEELRRFGQDMIEYAGRRRTRVADEQRRRTKKAGPKRRARAKAKLDAEVKKLPPSQQKAVEKAVARYEREAEKDADQLRQDLLLYRTLATIGTTSAQIAHETFNPALALIDLAVEIEDLAREDFEEHWDSLAPAVEQIDALAQRLRDYARLPRVLLHEPKRRMKTFSADAALSDTVSVFGPLMKRHTVLVDETYNAADAKLRGPSALLDAIISNLLINAIHALDHQAKGQRRVLVRTAQEDDKFVLEVADNGPGITELDIDDIWVPGATTTPDGTGLGLTIVRDSAEQLGGGVAADAQGALGGAHFTIRIPVAS